jgi:hypothetical protein
MQSITVLGLKGPLKEGNPPNLTNPPTVRVAEERKAAPLGELAGGRNVDKGTQFLCAILSLGPLGVAASISSFSGPSAGGRESIALAAKQPPLVHALSHHTALRARPFTRIHFHTLGLARCLDEHLCCRLEMLRPRVHLEREIPSASAPHRTC